MLHIVFGMQHIISNSVKIPIIITKVGPRINLKIESLTPKGRSPVFGPFLKFVQAIVDAIFVEKISTFW